MDCAAEEAIRSLAIVLERASKATPAPKTLMNVPVCPRTHAIRQVKPALILREAIDVFQTLCVREWATPSVPSRSMDSLMSWLT